ncbi:hypothetical protein C0Q70_19110 [Pomacea canaliculata]|uniref:Homeobox domain-containing protein n=1 Tax=Pomacea canaliculata TaxID=400727 RepID=A0A2T7NIE4_POMCA|nr:hypothetical protein C0Q70_19110 [Pomacea canaliculata]
MHLISAAPAKNIMRAHPLARGCSKALWERPRCLLLVGWRVLLCVRACAGRFNSFPEPTFFVVEKSDPGSKSRRGTSEGRSWEVSAGLETVPTYLTPLPCTPHLVPLAIVSNNAHTQERRRTRPPSDDCRQGARLSTDRHGRGTRGKLMPLRCHGHQQRCQKKKRHPRKHQHPESLALRAPQEPVPDERREDHAGHHHQMTLTQVSTWFANARRRLKKENKMTWSPRNRSGDADGDGEGDDDDEDDAKSKDGDESNEKGDQKAREKEEVESSCKEKKGERRN